MIRVFDATPLIYLAKVDRLGLIADLDGRNLIPEAVYDEVVTVGMQGGYEDARRIDRAVEDGIFEVVSVERDDSRVAAGLARHPGLSEADVDVLVCADAREAVAILDEAAGCSAAVVEGIETRGTAFPILMAVKKGIIETGVGREVIDEMIETGWYLTPELYTKVVRKLESLGE
ncbi:DUF3368 domain-containing protein [Halorubrum vacuolatum]|uniref:Predicted nucleic acid-binding protein, contains PIN domain n=1 Tax=Halorubrum vacuolatum TaxID=63740 RepID=A0A238WK09_HALVU|nr:DUF3368 domain-containing protein [Halorubrum vacuolatum]SNR46671.1 Predicted nucleic acid-binding protein, contains PIN domain [Halorubrum vacuolatum]